MAALSTAFIKPPVNDRPSFQMAKSYMKVFLIEMWLGV
jgi:hypothetical protein